MSINTPPVSCGDLELLGKGEKRSVFHIGKSVLKVPFSKKNQIENKLEREVDNNKWIKDNSPRTVSFKSLGIQSIDDIRKLSLSGKTQDSFLVDILKSKEDIIKYLEHNKQRNVEVGSMNIQQMIIGPNNDQKVKNIQTGEITTCEELMTLQRDKWRQNSEFDKIYQSILRKMTNEIAIGFMEDSLSKMGIDRLKNGIIRGNIQILKSMIRGKDHDLQSVITFSELKSDIQGTEVLLENFEKLCSSRSYRDIAATLVKEVSIKMKNINLGHALMTDTNLGLDMYGNIELFDRAVPKHEYVSEETWEQFWKHLNPKPNTKVIYEFLSEEEELKHKAQRKAVVYKIQGERETYKSQQSDILDHH